MLKVCELEDSWSAHSVRSSLLIDVTPVRSQNNLLDWVGKLGKLGKLGL